MKLNEKDEKIEKRFLRLDSLEPLTRLFIV